MPHVEFHRIDLHVAVQRSDRGRILATVSPFPGDDGAASRGVGGTLSAVIEHLRRDLAQTRISLRAGTTPMPGRIWTGLARNFRGEPNRPTRPLLRIAFEAIAPAAHVLDLESSFRPLQRELWDAAGMEVSLVRVTRVRPRALNVDFTLPLRILQVDPVSDWRIADSLQQLFVHPAPDWQDAAQAAECSSLDLAGFRSRSGWPTAEVLHFDHWSALAARAAGASAVDVQTIGTLGWLARLADTWQTRLVVLHCAEESDAAPARELAARLVAQGGPAVLVTSFPHGAVATEVYREFYFNLIHDFPHDANLTEVWRKIPEAASLPLPALFAGAGREESARVSTVGVRLLKLGVAFDQLERLASTRLTVGLQPPFQFDLGLRYPEPPLTRDFRVHRRSVSSENEELRTLGLPLLERLESTTGSPLALRGELKSFGADWDNWAFEFHESDGLIPLSKSLRSIRQIAGPAPSPQPAPAGPRFVNASFADADADGTLVEIDRHSEVLTFGRTYHLGVEIAPVETGLRISGALPLLEEIFKWTPEMPGVWIEVGITGLDFEVIGAPVQELWLPRTGASERIHFAVQPLRAGAARLRLCIYFRQNVLQSIRVAATTVRAGGPKPERDRLRKDLAEALSLSSEESEDDLQHARLEFALSPDFSEIERYGERTVSIVANDLAGVPVITIKDKDRFSVHTNNDIEKLVAAARNALVQVSLKDPKAPEPAYAFSEAIEQRDAAMNQALKTLATAGWRLFSAVAPPEQEKRGALRALFDGEGCTVQVAHVLLEKVIPWALVYDRAFDPDTRKDPATGKKFAFEVCPAGLDVAHRGCDSDSPFDYPPLCPLHPDQLARRTDTTVARQTVVCPRHFWGFRHIIELPVQQTTDPQQPAPPPREEVRATAPAQLIAAFHAGLDLFKGHRDEMQALLRARQLQAHWRAWQGDRDDFLESLKKDDLDLIYLYCHAECEDDTETQPFLKLRGETAPVGEDDGIIRPEGLDGDAVPLWTHHPLVFLNGCGTAAFSPRALSPFITRLVHRRGAAAVLGTEAPVWEQVATQMAAHFLAEFLAGRPAGEALLAARCRLLAEKNPLGLNYTLYGPARLKLPPDFSENSGAVRADAPASTDSSLPCPM